MFNELKRIADALESIASDISEMRTDQKAAREWHDKALEESKQATQGLLGQFTNLLTGGMKDG
jgi:hypothetical protein